MSDDKETKHLEVKKKSKKIKKSYNLMDFVVVKKKNKKTQKISKVKVSKQIQKRGKARKKKLTTTKKRILNERFAKSEYKSALETIVECNEHLKPIEESFAQIDINQDINESQDETLHEHEVPLQALNENKPVKTAINDVIKHSRNFREYCNHFITPEIRHLTEQVLKDLFKFQENKFEQNPVKAKANKRYVVGFKEVKKFLLAKRLKLVIIAPDLEKNSEIERLVNDIVTLADHHKIPCVFSIKRRHIGYVLLKKVSVSLVGIFDYQGTSENVNELLKLVQQEKINYRNKMKTLD